MQNLFANATPISGASGSDTGNNDSATAETGEPKNNGRTMWCAWTCPTDGNYYFSTRASSFPTILQAFTGSSVGELTEIGYLLSEQNGIGNGFEFGARIAFSAAADSVYYIRIDSRTALTGDIALNWDNYFMEFLGKCNGCGITFSQGVTYYGTETVTVFTTENYFSFGTFDAGIYLISYCYGAFCNDTGLNTWVSIGNEADGNPVERVVYVNESGIAYQNFSYGFGEFSNQIEAQNAAYGSTVLIVHSGGEIKIEFRDFPVTDNANGSPNPTFQLYGNILPTFEIIKSSKNLNSGCSGFSGSFFVRNLNFANWGGITVQILNEGDVSGASETPVSMGDIASFATVETPTLTFDSSATDDFQAVIRLTITEFNGNLLSDLGLDPFVIDVPYEIVAQKIISVSENECSVIRSGDYFSGTFDAILTTTSGDFFPCDQYTAELQNSGGVLDASSAVSCFDSNTGQNFSFSFNTPSGNTSIDATILIKDSDGNTIATLIYNATPIISATATNVGTVANCSGHGSANKWSLTVKNSGLGPTINLVASLTRGFACAGGFPITIGVLGAGESSIIASSIQIQAPFTVSFTDGSITYPELDVI